MPRVITSAGTFPREISKLRREPGRGASEDVSELPPGADLRLPEYRRETFLRFYEFHLENRSHPGCVYYAMLWLAKKHKLDQEQKLWLAFINGNTQNIVTSWIIFQRFPEPCSELAPWFKENYTKLAWDTDRRYHKKEFLQAVTGYSCLTGGRQEKYFRQFERETEEEAFEVLWNALRADFHAFGRLSSFSYAEYLRIMGVPIVCNHLFLDDMSGSRSHRNGLAKVLGRDDLDWYKEHSFAGDYTSEELVWLKAEGAALLKEAQGRLFSNVAVDEVNYFTLESALCTYKSWHRKNRRYGNVYNDLFHDRIKLAERNWGKAEVQQFWDCREECVPRHLRLESNVMDPGCVPEKQNYYRETGRPIMMSKRWPEFENSFDRRIWGML